MSRLQLNHDSLDDDFAKARSVFVNRLSVFARRNQWLRFCQQMLLLTGLTFGLWLVLLIADAVFNLPVAGRAAGLIAWVAWCFFSLIWLLRRTLRIDSIAATGLDIDRSISGSGSTVSMGLSLSEDPTGFENLRRALAYRALDQARQCALAITPRTVYGTKRLIKPVTYVWWAVATGLAIAILFPGLLTTTTARIAVPWGGIPAYNLTTLSVSWLPSEPQRGEDVLLIADPTGLEVKQIDLLFLDADGQEVSRLPLTKNADDRFSIRLRAVTEPLRFRFMVHGRATARYEIIPVTTAQQARDEEERDEPEDQMENAGVDGQLVQDRNASPALTDALRELLTKVARLREKLAATEAGDAAQMQKLEEDIATVLDEAERLKSQIEGSSAAGLSQALQALAENLAELKLANLPDSGGGPSAGSPETSTDAQAEMQRWLDQAAEAAASDEQTLRDGVGALENWSESGTSNRGGAESTDLVDPIAEGEYSTQQPNADTGILPPSTYERIPPRYREHISEYFRQLAEQEQED